MEIKPSCPFCTLEPTRILFESMSFNVISDGFPISPGHTLIVAKQHISSIFELASDSFLELHAVMHSIKFKLDQELNPDSYNIGINEGPAAGQTIPHLHIHIIPRFKDDIHDPRGGIRWVLPEKAKYWES